MIPTEEAQLWWAGKEMQRGKKLQDYVGKNEKTKIVVKLQKVPTYLLLFLGPLADFSVPGEFETCSISPQRGQGAPAREPLVTEEQQKQMMLHYHRRQEELKVSTETVALQRAIVLP